MQLEGTQRGSQTQCEAQIKSGNKFNVAAQSKASEALILTLVGRWEWNGLLTSCCAGLTANPSTVFFSHTSKFLMVASFAFMAVHCGTPNKTDAHAYTGRKKNQYQPAYEGFYLQSVLFC